MREIEMSLTAIMHWMALINNQGPHHLAEPYTTTTQQQYDDSSMSSRKEIIKYGELTDGNTVVGRITEAEKEKANATRKNETSEKKLKVA